MKVYLIAPKNPASFWPSTAFCREYVQETSRALDGLIRELRKGEPAP